MVARFRLPYTPRQVYAMLLAACQSEVASRHRRFVASDEYLRHIADIARWLTSEGDTTFGLFLCGNRGNGKTTLVKAMKSLYNFLHSDEGYSTREDRFPFYGFEIISAKELVLLAKSYNNRTKDNAAEVARYKRLSNVEVLCIDDLGTEPRESLNYGDYVNAAMDMVNYRYEEQLCTMATSNLAADEIRQYYDERFADRFREMMRIVDFGNETSFRTIKQD